MTDTGRPAQTGRYRSVPPSNPYVKDPQGSALFTIAQSCGILLARLTVDPKCPHSEACGITMKSNKRKQSRTNGSFDPQVFLDTAGVARKVVEYHRGESIFSQGESAATVMYVQKGGVKLSVVNGSGKEAVVAMFGPTDFFGEGCMAGQTVRMGTTTAVTPTTLLVIQKEELLRVLHAEHELSDHFIAYMLAHNIRVEEDLVDQLFNSSEKRLARALLLLARYGMQEQPDRILPKVSQETLASMVGTTRSRVNFFMNKFRKLGFIEYNGKIKINKSLLTVVLHE
jgi:CRP/FNR family cyclic AMP-dependent transcriptional regulator